MKSNLRYFLQRVFDQVKQSSEAYQLNVVVDISSLGTVLAQDFRGMCAGIIELLDGVRGDVWDSSECPFLQ